MNILIYRYGSICEPDVIDAFRQVGLNVIEETTEITQKNLSNAQRVELVEKDIRDCKPLFVFSINFYPALAEICHIYKTMYLCWTVDSPVPELFCDSVTLSTNRVFLFDRAQYHQFSPYNPDFIFHLPLASATTRFDHVIASITASDKQRFSGEITFVGSLYNEKSPLTHLPGLSDYAKGYLKGLEESSLRIYGSNFLEDALTPGLIDEIKALDSHFYNPGKSVTATDSYVVAHSYIGMDIAVKERMQTLNTLARFFPVDLYTQSDSSALQNVNVRGSASSLTEMPKIFHLSKINLNMTIKPIQEGLPLRIFDILGCGGFCMTNYQAELPEYFEIGVDLEAYSSMEELVDKCAYYLEHEDERKQIALNGYRKVCEQHTYFHRIKEMIRTLS